MPTKFSLGSKSQLKRRALIRALESAGHQGSVPVTVQAYSGVNAQPVGVAEIARGANSRAKFAAVAVPGSFGVGIESGIVYDEDSGWVDQAMVVIILPDGRTVSSWSKAVPLPARYVNEAESSGFATTTVGQRIAADLGGAADDPVTTLTKGQNSREAQLSDAIAAALVEAKETAKETVRNTVEHYGIRVGSVERRLPVREVAPGVRVALFNILGDWVLTEAAGKELARHIGQQYPECEALVMPDGKATALLHVLGREMRMLTFVARKERKPYMGEGVRSVNYRSITTNREQSLFLSADDAAACEGRRVVIVDDVISTGGTVDAVRTLMGDVGATVIGLAAVFCEGSDRADVCSLGVLPLF